MKRRTKYVSNYDLINIIIIMSQQVDGGLS